ncbi:hypothetical protein AB0L22_28230 [Micromonospora haikouensis]|uniref:hypothetical protein n=1 Tax=Micromonospora haikouensis TaxID=686309 RepID=UPI00341BB607
MTTALATLSVPGASSASGLATGAPNSHVASASDKGPVVPGNNVTYWVEKNPPAPSKRALQMAAEMEKLVSPMASGGGCKNTQGLGVCISWTDTQLKGDFYVNNWSGVVQYGTARLYINYKGTLVYKYTVVTDHLGAYPVATHGTSGSGSGYTLVDTFNQSGTSIGGGTSPYQYFP